VEEITMASNFLRNGTVLPSGLLTHDVRVSKEAFKKTFQNFTLKSGIIVASYAVGEENNLSKLYTEYDVLAFEQHENKGAVPSYYFNCPLASSLGSIADYFEMNLRPLEKQTTQGTVPTPSGQDGSCVLLLCLNGLSDTAIIVGGSQHPDRPTNLTTTDPHLVAEYNGVNIEVNMDGSTALTFKGATDNSGVPTDPSQGNTVVTIETDGSFEVSHKTITFALAKDGTVTLTTTGEVNITATGNVNMTTQGNVDIKASGTATIDSPTINLGANASHPIILGDIFKQLYDNHSHPTPIGPTGPPVMPLSPDALSKVSETE
jgi:hypothetical protein